tara:strand:+ start:2871 stop:4223 length:1353 start_codon:yes stop_codon:yes gene_type:complete
MIKQLKYLYFFLIFFLFLNCSFDKKTGIWDSEENEKKRISDLEMHQKSILDTVELYSSENKHTQEIISKKKINLTIPKKNLSWNMSGMNYQNFFGHIYLPKANDIFLKKKIGKNKFSLGKNLVSPVVFGNNIIFSDDRGTIFSISKKGKVNWKRNIYKKIYKKIYKTLSIGIYEDAIYISDNIGFIYKLDARDGKVIWIKNHGIPIKSEIKIFEGKIYSINQDNRLICLNTNDGSMIWNSISIQSFIKSQQLLSLAISKEKDLVILNSSGELVKLKIVNGQIYWTLSALGSLYAHDADFFRSSKIVLTDNEIIFSTENSTFSFNLDNGQLNWQINIGSINTPIIDANNVFIVTNNGYFINLDKRTGNIIWSTNILKVLKEKKQNTNVTGFILGSGKIYATTSNGYLITSSADFGKIESFKKIGDEIYASPIIHDEALFILTENSRIFGLN